MKINANGINFNYQVDGAEGAPWIIFSNSLMTNLSIWDDQAAALKNEFRVLRYDQRGHGGTDAPPGKYSFATLTDDVIALMDGLSIKRAHFAGISMGGMTALFLAERYGDRFDRIFPCDCGPASTPQSAQQWKERIDLGAEKGMEALVEPTIARWFPPESLATKKPVVDKVRDMIRTTNMTASPAAPGRCPTSTPDRGLAASRTPCCDLRHQGRDLPGHPGDDGTIPGAKLVDIEGAGHIANVEQPDPFTKAIRHFVKG